MSEIVEAVEVEGNTKIAVFSTENSNKQKREDYFLDSAWQVQPFFEVDALDPKSGKLIVDK